MYLSMAHLDPDYVRRRFPAITERVPTGGPRSGHDRIPVSPAAHYVMGGVETDLDGRTSIAGLFAAGEAACTGVHGANRLASNSLLEGLVFGARAADAMIAPVRPGSCFAVPDHTMPRALGSGGSSSINGGESVTHTVRDPMWRHGDSRAGATP